MFSEIFDSCLWCKILVRVQEICLSTLTSQSLEKILRAQVLLSLNWSNKWRWLFFFENSAISRTCCYGDFRYVKISHICTAVER